MLKFLARAFFLQDLVAKFFALIPSAISHNFGKYKALHKSFYLTSLEGLSGDYLEFGVYTGSSMSAAIQCSRTSVVPRQRPAKYFGFDSFKGFGKLNEDERSHPFFQDSFFEVSPELTEKRLSGLLKDKTRLKLIVGFYEDTLRTHLPEQYGIGKAIVILVDCDTFSGATLVFDFIKTSLQAGTILIIDDFFSYKGSSRLGPYGAFLKFQSELPEWSFRHVFDYGYGGVAFMATK